MYSFNLGIVPCFFTVPIFKPLASLILTQINFTFSSPKISSHIFFKFSTSLSSIDINITPSFVNKFLANFNLEYIILNQTE